MSDSGYRSVHAISTINPNYKHNPRNFNQVPSKAPLDPTFKSLPRPPPDTGLPPSQEFPLGLQITGVQNKPSKTSGTATNFKPKLPGHSRITRITVTR